MARRWRQVYAGSNFMAERDQTLQDGYHLTHFAEQAVVLYPSAKKADAFLTASAQQWPACHQYTRILSKTQWTVGGDIQHQRHIEHHRNSTERQRPRLGLWAGAGGKKQCRHRRHHVQRQPRGFGRHHRQPDRRQSTHLMAPAVEGYLPCRDTRERRPGVPRWAARYP